MAADSVLRQRRERAGLSAYAAARQLGMSPERLLLIERGQIVPNEKTCERLSTLLGGTITEYLDAPLQAESPGRRR
jgi:transcriptional regulator with XRE-family HTH domain